MKITYTEQELESALSTIFVSLTAKDVVLEVPEVVAACLGWDSMRIKYNPRNEGGHQFWLEVDPGSKFRWSSNLYHGTRRRFAATRESIPGLVQADLPNMRMGVAEGAIIVNGKLSVLLGKGGPSRLEGLEAIAKNDLRTTVVMEQPVPESSEPAEEESRSFGGDYYATIEMTLDLGDGGPHHKKEVFIHSCDVEEALFVAKLGLAKEQRLVSVGVREHKVYKDTYASLPAEPLNF